MADLTPIAVDPMTIAAMCVSAKREIPDWVVNILTGDNLLDALKYNKELPYLHYHVQRTYGRDYDETERDLAFMKEHDADAFIDRVSCWDNNDPCNYAKNPCYKDTCDVYTDDDGLMWVGNVVEKERRRA